MRLIDADKLKQDLLDRSFFPAIVKRAMENAPTVNPYEWISVEDRLPETRTRVLCYFKAEQDYPDLVCENFYYGGGHWLSEGSRATHWMPLPELPTENSK